MPGRSSAPATFAIRARSRRSSAAPVARFGQLDIVIGNAGVGGYGPFLDLPAEQIEEMIDINVKGLIYTYRAALPQLLKSDAADVVTVASEAGGAACPTRRSTARPSSRRWA